MPQPLLQKKLKVNRSMMPARTSRTNTKKNVSFITADWNAKGGSQEIPGVIGKFDLGVQNEAGQRLTEFWQESAPVFQHTRKDCTLGHHQVVNTEIRLIIFFAAEAVEALYSQQKQDQELNVAHELFIAKFRLIESRENH